MNCELENIDSNFLDYLNGFSENVQDIIQKFKFRNQLETFETTGITFSLLEKFCSPKVELQFNQKSCAEVDRRSIALI